MKQLVFKKNQKINKKMIFVSKENLSHNYRQIDKFSGNSKVISVIKGDGYGHGLLECCKILKTNKCKDFYVARLDDAIKLRENFKNINIYLLSGVISNNDLKEIKKNKIIPIILAGGTGTRLWPISRKSFPKQFLELTDDDLSLIHI